jgi:hypothetical protein
MRPDVSASSLAFGSCWAQATSVFREGGKAPTASRPAARDAFCGTMTSERVNSCTRGAMHRAAVRSGCPCRQALTAASAAARSIGASRKPLAPRDRLARCASCWRTAEAVGALRKLLARRGHFELKCKNYAPEYQLERLTTLAHHPRTPVGPQSCLETQGSRDRTVMAGWPEGPP